MNQNNGVCMKTICVIPARYDSSRLPGKPLADICGKPMVWWVYNEAKKVKEYSDVIVATDSNVVVKECDRLGVHTMMTSNKHSTGTDRVAEVASRIKADMFVTILGDEPLLLAEDQRDLLMAIHSGIDADAFQLVYEIENPIDAVNTTTVKLAVNDRGYCIYLSRAAIPSPKEAINYKFIKNTGCFAMRSEALQFFLETERGNIECAEDIEQLRLIENHRKIFTVKAKHLSLSVDTPKDLKRVQGIIKRRLQLECDGELSA